MKKFLLAIALFVTPFSVLADISGKPPFLVAYNNYGSTAVTTGTWVQLVASMPLQSTLTQIYDTSGQVLQLGTGLTSGTVTPLNFYIGRGGNGNTPIQINQGAKVWIKAVTSTANAGDIIVNFF